MCKVSIVMPVYNKEKYIENTIKSILQQTFNDWELLIVDDGSSDNSSFICDEFASSDNRFKVFHIENGGVSHARNVGIENASGKYITFIDADDKISDDYIEDLYRYINNDFADMVIGGYQKIWENSVKEEVVKLPFSGMKKMKDILPTFAQVQQYSGIYGCCVNKIFKTSLLDMVRFDENISLAEDFDFYLKLYPYIKTIYFNDKPNYYYLQATENSSAMKCDAQIDYMSQLMINLRYRQFLKNLNVYQKNNKMIVEKLISNYVFFSLFYCQLDELRDRFTKLIEICKSENISINVGNILQKWLLLLVNRNLFLPTKLTLYLYHIMKKIIKKV